jgi:peptidoglycan/LPS O-acetylase OafA/YrhL
MSQGVAVHKTSDRTKSGYYPVLDALRFVLALWVAIGHFEMIQLWGDPNSGFGLWHWFKRGWDVESASHLRREHLSCTYL